MLLPCRGRRARESTIPGELTGLVSRPAAPGSFGASGTAGTGDRATALAGHHPNKLPTGVTAETRSDSAYGDVGSDKQPELRERDRQPTFVASGNQCEAVTTWGHEVVWYSRDAIEQ